MRAPRDETKDPEEAYFLSCCSLVTVLDMIEAAALPGHLPSLATGRFELDLMSARGDRDSAINEARARRDAARRAEARGRTWAAEKRAEASAACAEAAHAAEEEAQLTRDLADEEHAYVATCASAEEEFADAQRAADQKNALVRALAGMPPAFLLRLMITLRLRALSKDPNPVRRAESLAALERDLKEARDGR